MTERCIKWNVPSCKFSNNITFGMDCPIDGTVTCNTEVLKARHKPSYRVDKLKGGIIGGKISK